MDMLARKNLVKEISFVFKDDFMMCSSLLQEDPKKAGCSLSTAVHFGVCLSDVLPIVVLMSLCGRLSHFSTEMSNIPIAGYTFHPCMFLVVRSTVSVCTVVQL